MSYEKKRIQIRIAIKNAKNIIISAHQNPDGDAIGSALALYHLTTSMGIKTKIILSDAVPPNYKFLSGADKIEVYDKEKHFIDFLSVDTIIVVDLNDQKRLGRLKDPFMNTKVKKIMIDHHENPYYFASPIYSDPSASSTALLVYKLIASYDDYTISKEMAEALYTGIITDSGNFRYPRTTSQLHRVTAELIDCGADPVEIYEKIYNQNSQAFVKILAKSLDSMELYLDGKLCIMIITDQMLQETGTTNQDIDLFAERTLSIEGVIAGVMLSNLEDSDNIRISMRSKGEFSVAEVAKSMGGGGHFHAAGAREFNKDIFDVRDDIINTFREFINQYKLNI